MHAYTCRNILIYLKAIYFEHQQYLLWRCDLPRLYFPLIIMFSCTLYIAKCCIIRFASKNELAAYYMSTENPIWRHNDFSRARAFLLACMTPISLGKQVLIWQRKLVRMYCRVATASLSTLDTDRDGVQTRNNLSSVEKVLTMNTNDQ